MYILQQESALVPNDRMRELRAQLGHIQLGDTNPYMKQFKVQLNETFKRLEGIQHMMVANVVLCIMLAC